MGFPLALIRGSVFKNAHPKPRLLPNLCDHRGNKFHSHCGKSPHVSGVSASVRAVSYVRTWGFGVSGEDMAAARDPHPAELVELGSEVRHLLLHLLMLRGLLFKFLFHFI